MANMKIFSGAKLQHMAKFFSGVKLQNMAKFFILQIRVFRDLLLFHMFYDFTLDTSGSKRTMSHFLCLRTYL